MSVLFPAFLWALAALAIPVFIHLFNLRKYKKFYFPHTRFLKNVVLQSRRQSELQQKLLLTLRLLFLACLILAFAQPYFSTASKKNEGSKLYTLFIDNSNSMSAKMGATDLLEKSKQAAYHFIQQLPNQAQLLIATHDAPTIYEPLTKEKALGTISDIDFTASQRSPEQVIQQTQSMMETEGVAQANIIYLSDFQKNIGLNAWKSLPKNMTFTGVLMQAEQPQNIFIDSAWQLDEQLGANSKLVVRTKTSLPVPSGDHLLQLKINGQLRSAATARFNEEGISIDTLGFAVNDDGWQKILVSIQDKNLPFDDSFRIAARMARQLQIEHVYQGAPGPYLVAALHSDPLMQVTQKPWQSGQQLGQANLIVIEGLNSLSASEAEQIKKAIAAGSSVVLFPARNTNYQAFNPGLSVLGSIQFSGYDTAAQTIAGIQQSHELVKEIFEQIPRQVQLPTVNWHYNIRSGFQANQQAVMTFRNGDPFMARYDVAGGQFYLSSTSASMDAGNFTGSYFFVPFLYKMAMLNKGNNSYAIRSGQNQWVHLPIKAAGERNPVHLFADGKDIIPMQTPAGNGVNVFTDGVIHNSGFYTLQATGNDSVLIAVNPNVRESQLHYYSHKELNQAANDQVQFISADSFQQNGNTTSNHSFPIWKVCVFLALLLFAAECWVLWKNILPRSATIQTNSTSV